MENYRNEKWLRYQYEELRKYQSEIAKEENVAQSVISRWMKRFGIESRGKGTRRENKYNRIGTRGYRRLYKPDYPQKNDYVKKARLIMEKKLGRYLTPQEIVHHRDLDKLNDNIENLQLMSNSEHTTLHQKIKGFLKDLEGL